MYREKNLLFPLGPGAYNLGTAAVYPSAPSYTIGGRHRDIENERTPGPVYALPDISLFKPGPPSYTFGVRHSWREARFLFEYKE